MKKEKVTPSLLRMQCIVLGVLLGSVTAQGWETDQFSDRRIPLRDSTEVLNARMNDAVEKFALQWRDGKPEDDELVDRFMKAVNGGSWLGQLMGDYEKWLTFSNQVERHSLSWPDTSIYADAPVSASHANWLMGSCATFVLAGQRMGTDKPGHFLSQGYELYREYAQARRGGLDERSALGAAFTKGQRLEETYFGLWVSGVYSNADLVANAEGFAFLRQLPAYFKWDGRRLSPARPFDWRDYVSEYWDEALLPSWLSPELQQAVTPRLRGLCEDYVADPAMYTLAAERDEVLQARYANLGLRPAPQNRLDRVCAGAASRP